VIDDSVPARADGSTSAPEPPQVVARGDEPAPLTFPDLPRMELDQLLAQLVERAQEVMATQGRLRGLLRANQVIAGGLALPVVLRRIVEAARELVGARFGALGVLAPDGGLAEFVHVGVPQEVADRIGHLPVGKGLLGALIEEPAPIRLNAIDADPRSCGFPPGHPRMTSFLGVPIRVRDEVFGNLYLAESTRGGFTAEDEQLVTALAATAAAAIDNARLYEAARSRGEWLQATATITRHLLSPDTGDMATSLRLIAELSRDVARADLVTVLLPTSDGKGLRAELAVGASADDLHGTHYPLDTSFSGQVFTSALPLRMAAPDEQAGIRAAVPARLDAGPVLVVPLLGLDHTRGVLALVRLRGRPAFSAEDEEMAAGFANQASIAIELAQARADQQRAALLDERERIAADLHDHVIQRLFATGLSLQALAATLGPGRATDRVLQNVRELDTTISQIRTAIFQLNQATEATPRNLRSRVLEVVAEVSPALGHEPAVRFSGLLDSVPDAVGDDLLAVLREALTNIARHARASSTDVDLSARTDRLTLEVRDNGVGIGDTTRRSGLATMLRRAEQHGGSLAVEVNRSAGTRLTWSVPLAADA
jgi:signal transduction histidine kinase